ncbi:MAG: DUF1778 domain-containing protein [Verrucomicrobiota bacterium]|nr:DUF1778 domain-containing protein [Verrucomicrobiota bacterium]
MIKAVQAVLSKGMKIMQNSKQRDEDTDEITLEYFQRWKKRDLKSEKIYVRLRPEEKKIILSACSATGLSITDMVLGAALEASEVVIKSYRARFPNDPMFKRPSLPA